MRRRLGTWPSWTINRRVSCKTERKSKPATRATDINDYMRKAVQAMESRRGRGELAEAFTSGVRRFRVHGVKRYVDVDTILERVISFGAR